MNPIRYLSPFLLFLVLLSSTKNHAGSRNIFFQDNEEWFLKMAKEDRFQIDTSAVAVILYEKCVTEMQFTTGVQRNVRQIIKILRRSGNKYGDFRIIMPTDRGGSLAIRSVRGTTYQYNGSGLTSLKLNQENLARDKTDFITQVKGSMPGVEPGVVLDISYTISHPISLMFAEWEFQHEIPTLYSELEVWVPSVFEYFTMFRGGAIGFAKFDDTRKSLRPEQVPAAYVATEITLGNDMKHERWVRRNVRAVVAEPMAPELSNFQERMQLRINMARIGPYSPGILDTWPRINKLLYESPDYFQGLRRKCPSAMEKAAALTLGMTDPQKKAKAIFRFLRSSIQNSGYSNIYFGNDLDKVLHNRSGTPSEINSLLIAMLWHVGIPARPILIATNDTRMPAADFPDIAQFNRTICQAHIGGTKVLLDASDANIPFGMLPTCDYNGYARVVDDKDGSGIELEASALNERSQIIITTENDELSDYVLRVSCRFGAQDAYDRRNAWQKDSAQVRRFLQPCINRAGMNATLLNYRLDGLQDPDTNLTLSFAIRLDWPPEGKAYFNPHLISPVPRNPFIASERSLPVQLPAKQDARLVVNIRIPEGYRLEERPKAAVVSVNTSDFYKYITGYDVANRILQINSTMHLDRTWYPSDEYESIKQFYDKIVAQYETTYVFSK